MVSKRFCSPGWAASSAANARDSCKVTSARSAANCTASSTGTMSKVAFFSGKTSASLVVWMRSRSSASPSSECDVRVGCRTYDASIVSIAGCGIGIPWCAKVIMTRFRSWPISCTEPSVRMGPSCSMQAAAFIVLAAVSPWCPTGR